MYKTIIKLVLFISNIQNNVMLKFDFDSPVHQVVGESKSNNFIHWNGSIQNFIENFPLNYNEFVFSDIDDEFMVTLSYKGDLEKDLPYVYLYVLDKCELKIQTKMEESIFVDSLKKDIVTSEYDKKKQGGGSIIGNEINYRNSSLPLMLKIISSHYNNCNIMISKNIPLNQSIDLKVLLEEDFNTNDISTLLSNIGIVSYPSNEKRCFVTRKK